MIWQSELLECYTLAAPLFLRLGSERLPLLPRLFAHLPTR